MGLPFETNDYYYLIRMSPAAATSIIRGDDDYDDEGFLKASVKADYEDKHDDLDFLDELNANDDNDLGIDDDDDDDDIDLDQLASEEDVDDDFL
jgi:hypothetical protein